MGRGTQSENGGNWLLDDLLPRLVLPLLWVGTVAVLLPLLGAAVEDPPPSGYGAVAVLAMLLALVEWNVAMRLLGRPASWHPGLGPGAGRLALGGLVLAFLFAAGLFAWEYQGQLASKARRAQIERDQREGSEQARRASEALEQADRRRPVGVMPRSSRAAVPAPAVVDTPAARALFGTWTGTRGKPLTPDYADWRVELKPARKGGYIVTAARIATAGPCRWSRTGDAVVLSDDSVQPMPPLPLTLTVRPGDAGPSSDTTLVTPDGLVLRR